MHYNGREDNDGNYTIQLPDEDTPRIFHEVDSRGQAWFGDRYNFDNDNVINLTTVQENEQRFSKREVNNAKSVKEFVDRMGYPSINELIRMFKSGAINNLPFSLEDINRAYEIYGPDVPAIKGKTTVHKPTKIIIQQGFKSQKNIKKAK